VQRNAVNEYQRKNNYRECSEVEGTLHGAPCVRTEINAQKSSWSTLIYIHELTFIHLYLRLQECGAHMHSSLYVLSQVFPFVGGTT
jgi:hypothetical protein